MYKSGFCGIGCHEGTSPKSASGRPMKVCNIPICECQCHEKFAKLFSDTDTTREFFPNPKYEPEVHAFIMPDFTRERFITVEAGEMDGRDRGLLLGGSERSTISSVKEKILESPLPGFIPGNARKHYEPSNSGRARRGQMELWVKEVTDEWTLNAERDIYCTSAYAGAEIARVQGVPTPPRGSIDSVFYKWRDINFAILGDKPLRFVRYTSLGIEIGLDGCVAEHKRTKR